MLKPPRSTFAQRASVYMRELRGFFARRTSAHIDPDDLTQEALVRAITAAEKQTIENDRAFLFGVARNVLRAEISRRVHMRETQLADFDDLTDFLHENASEPEAEWRSEWRLFAKAVEGLPPQCRKVFTLKKVYGYSQKEIAAKLNISTSTVEKHVAAALKRVIQVSRSEQSETTVVSAFTPVREKTGKKNNE